MSQEQCEVQKVIKPTGGKNRLSFVQRLRSFTGSRSAQKHSSSRTSTESSVTSPRPSPPTLTVTPSSPSSAAEPPSFKLSISAEARRTAEQPSSPRVDPSHSLSHAVCCGCSQSPHHVSSASGAARRPTDLILANSQATFNTTERHPSSRSHVLKEESVTASGSSSSMPKRASFGSDPPPPKAGVTFSKRSSSREKVSGSKSLPISEKTEDSLDPRSTKTESSLSRSNEATVGEKERERDRSTSREATGRARPKSVCVVAPSDSKMLRRAFSEKAKVGANITASKTAPLSRHSSISTRKSMSSLAVEQGSSPEAERGVERAESPLRESRKSATSSTTGSVSSHTPDTVTLQDSSPKLSPDIKKVDEYSDLPSYVSKSKNAKFHKLFKNVPLHEYPIDTYSCAFKGDILLQGVMYVSQNWICFYSKIRARGRLLEIPLEKVISITREKLALIIPNAIGVQVADHKYVFGSFMSRDNTYKLLVTLLKHSQDSTDSASPKESEVRCSDSRVSLAGRRTLPSPPLHPEHVTHSADISAESDTTEDDDDNNNVLEREVLVETVASSSSLGGSGEGGERNRLSNLPSDKVPGFFSWKCMDYRKVALAFSSFTVKLQKVPRTNLLLAVCSVMVVFLVLSAVGLAYKIVLLQTRLEMSPHWVTARHAKLRDGSSSSIQWDSERATLHHMHDVLKANLQLLEQVHQSLKNLEICTTKKDCPPVQ